MTVFNQLMVVSMTLIRDVRPFCSSPFPQQAIHDAYGGVLDYVHLHNHYWALGQWSIVQSLPPVYLPSVLQSDSPDVHSVWSTWIHGLDRGHQASHQKVAAATDISCLREHAQHPIVRICILLLQGFLKKKKGIQFMSFFLLGACYSTHCIFARPLCELGCYLACV